MIKYLLILLTFLVYLPSFGFSSKAVEDKKTTEAVMAPTKPPVKPTTQSTVKVFKADSSLQCHADSGISLEDMAKQLNEIKIVSQARKHDGMMRTALCGTPTGYINIYEIAENDLEQAKSYGFKKL